MLPGPRSSEVERSLGKGKATGSIPVAGSRECRSAAVLLCCGRQQHFGTTAQQYRT